MKNHFEAERVTKPNPTEVRRLVGIFGGDLQPLAAVPTLAADYLTSNWDFDKPVANKHGLLECNFRIGPAALDVDFGQNMVFLAWNAALPPFLYPKQDIQSYLDFRDFVFEEFPEMLWSLTDRDSRPDFNYLANSTARVQYRGRPIAPKYDLGNEKDRIGLELDFIERSQKIKAISIDARPQGDPDKPGYFHLRLDYKGANDHQTKVSLGFKLDDFVFSAFNPEVVGWAVETNEHVEKIEDPIRAAHNLIEEIDPTLQIQYELAKAKRGLV